ncbi:MAG TPA: glycosyltransferase family 2 protein [Candidatus Hypogeohydataceae bacterium YC41]
MNKVLIIIPAYNEKKSIGGVVMGVKNTLPEADILVVNDGSTDGTSGEARQAGAMVLDLPCNMGLGVALQSGFIFAHKRDYRFVVRMDGDGQHRPSELKALLAPIERGDSDMVVGSRFLGKDVIPSAEGHTECRPTAARRAGIRFFSAFLSLLLGKTITDPTYGFQAMNRKAVSFFAREYPPDYPELEARLLAQKAGLNITEIPSRMLQRTGGVSSIDFFNSIYIVIEALTSTIVGMFRKVEN